MRRWLTAAIIGVATCVATWLSIGLEVTGVDHETRYVAFVKSHPTTKVLFRSYMGCDECDAQDFSTLSPLQQSEFAALCRAKYGFDEPRICNAIYAEQRKIMLEKLTARAAAKP